MFGTIQDFDWPRGDGFVVSLHAVTLCLLLIYYLLFSHSNEGEFTASWFGEHA